VFKIQDGFCSNFVKCQTKLLKMKKHLKTNLLEIIMIQTFYIVHFSVWESLRKQYSPNLESHINYMKLYVRIVHFQLHVPNTLQMQNGLYIKCRSWWVEQYWYSWLFQSRPSRVPKPVRGYELFQNSKLSTSNLVKWPIWRLQMKQFWIQSC